MLAIGLAETYGVAPPEYFSEDAVRPYISWTKDKPAFSELPRLAFSHTIPHQLANWGWARAIAGLPPYVLLVRHPMSILASHFAKWQWDIKVDWQTYLRGEPTGKQFRCDLFWIARFWNRWGEWLEREPGRIHLVKYEDIQADRRAALVAIAAHWGIEMTETALDAAVLAGTKEAMAERIDPNGEPNVLQNRSEALADLFSGEAMAIYREKTQGLFHQTLGYDLMSIPDKVVV